ncbi:MAG: uroporphyrinogen-III synthase [Planctomycetaceae bacterium]|nr:uroporphyrinogen-III synthase [Planctomycetaceae bacterium]
MNSTPPPPRVCSFESRRREEMHNLLERCGARPTVAPSMREVPLSENAAAFEFADHLLNGQIDAVICLTGVGIRTLLETVCERFDRRQILDALEQCRIIVRGPKPVAVLREWNIHVDHRAPEPNTWRELLQMLDDEHVPLAGETVAVQEYGKPSSELCAALTERGARVVAVPVYKWMLPEDTAPLESAVRQTVAGAFDALMFTSAWQLNSVLEVAARLGVRDEWLAAANRCVIASIGPTASETLRESGLAPDLEPSHPKMGHLVKETCERAAVLLAAKCAGQAPA